MNIFDIIKLIMITIQLVCLIVIIKNNYDMSKELNRLNKLIQIIIKWNHVFNGKEVIIF